MSKPDRLDMLRREIAAIPRLHLLPAETFRVQSDDGSKMIEYVARLSACWFERSRSDRWPRLWILILDRLSSAERDKVRRGAAYLRETWSRENGSVANDLELIVAWSVQGSSPPPRSAVYADCGRYCRLINLSARHLVIARGPEAANDVVVAPRPLRLGEQSTQVGVAKLLVASPACWGIIALPNDPTQKPGDLFDDFSIGHGLEISGSITARGGNHLFHRLSPLFI